MSEAAAISVSGVSKTFKLPHEKNKSVKSLVLNSFRRRRTYELQKALQDISFEVKEGEFFGIVGRNGSGKSTLLKLLAGIYNPDKGHIQVNGKLTPFIELGVGFNPELTGRENVFLNGALLGFNRKEMEAMYDEIVEFAELKGFMDQKLSNYSSGMQVRLAFSIAIRANTDILVLDEVLAVGDMTFQEKCFDYFERMKEEKKTIVFVSHDLKSVRRFCDRVLLIDKSVQIALGDTKDILEEYEFLVLDQTQKLQHQEAAGGIGYHIGTGQAYVDTPKLDKKHYDPGSDITLTFSFSMKDQSISTAKILFSLFDADGAKLISDDKLVKIKPGKNQAVSLKLKKPPLLPGIHKVNIGIFDEELHTIYDQYRDCARINITGDNPRGGRIQQPIIWEV